MDRRPWRDKGSGSIPRPPRILLVDDDDDYRGVLADVFAERGMLVIEAENGAVGIKEAQRTRPDVIVMDLDMPVMGGLEAIRRLREDARTHAIPIAVLSGNAFRDRSVAAKLGCPCLRKPCSLVDLEAVVDALSAPDSIPSGRDSQSA